MNEYAIERRETLLRPARTLTGPNIAAAPAQDSSRSKVIAWVPRIPAVRADYAQQALEVYLKSQPSDEQAGTYRVIYERTVREFTVSVRQELDVSESALTAF